MDREIQTTAAAAVNRVTLLVDNIRFSIDLALLVAHPNTMLGRLFCSGMEVTHLNERGEYEILGGISYSIFRTVINYYLNGVIICPSTSLQEVKAVCDYLMVPFNATTIRCENLSCLFHELSNDGGRGQFKLFFDDLIRPLMVVSAQKGDRECHVIILLENDAVDWDKECPPKMGEEDIQTTRSTPMCRFLKYVDNHNVATQVMTEQGLKKIRVGLSGYPMEMIKLNRPGEQPQKYYRYVQRPFLQMSWEKEEVKSRLVDYQFVNLT